MDVPIEMGHAIISQTFSVQPFAFSIYVNHPPNIDILILMFRTICNVQIGS